MSLRTARGPALVPSFPLALACLLAPAAARGAAPPAAPSAAPARPSLLLVTLDTTRADHLGCYGDRRAQTPNLDRIAAEGALCERAMTTAPMTLPAHASILTGLYPPDHGVRDNADFALPGTIPTLATHLSALGYRTSAVVSSIVLSRERGLARGFDEWDEPAAPRVPEGLYRPILESSAQQTTERALEILARDTGRPFFLWIHYFDPHADYAPPAPWSQRFASAPYDGEIAYMDSQLGRILEALRRSGRLDRTLVAVAGDHGESLGEHGEASHGLFLYDATLRVPLLLRWPSRVRAGRRVEGVVSLAGLAPTLLELMGLPALPRGPRAPRAPGRAFTAELGAARASAPASGPRDAVYAEAVNAFRVYGWAPLHAIRDRTGKFIDAPEPEVYDLASDPREKSNLVPGAPPALTASWRGRLESLFPGFAEAAPASAEASLDPEQRERLASLGYLGGGAGPPVRATPGDPKRLVAVHEAILRARALVEAGRNGDALALLEQALAVDPGNPAALGLAGSLQVAGGDRAAGLARLRASAAAAPGVYETRRNLADALHASGRIDEAIGEYRAALAIAPEARAWEGLGRALLSRGDSRPAADAFNESIRLGGPTGGRLAGLGAALDSAGDPAGAEARLRESLALDPSFAPAWLQLGSLLERAGRFEEARHAYDSAASASPAGSAGRRDALFDRGLLSVRMGRLPEASADLAALKSGDAPYAAAPLLEAAIELASGRRAAGLRILEELLARPGLDPRLKAAATALQASAGGGLSDQSRSEP